jgi:hypothetical protein
MTELLIEGCRINKNSEVEEYAENMDVEKAGHGKVMLKQHPSLS